MDNKQLLKPIAGTDTVVLYTSSRKVQDFGYTDLPSLSSWYERDPNKNHLGLVNLFSTMGDYRVPTLSEFFRTRAVLEVVGANGVVTYDLPVYQSSGSFTVGDTSNQGESVGIDGSPFKIILDRPYANGDVLTYDAEYGHQIIVAEDYAIEQEGDGWLHTVVLVSQNAFDTYPIDKLKSGVQYWKVGHGLGENSTQFSTISSSDEQGTLTCEFTLGNHRGVEGYVSMYADMQSVSGASVESRNFWDKIKAKMAQIGQENNLFVVGRQMSNGMLKKGSASIGATIESLVMLELIKMESYQLLYQRGGIIKDGNGVKRLNEGIMKQVRRGKSIKYARPYGITKNHIKQAVSYLYQGRDMQVTERRVHFKCGEIAYYNVLDLFRQEVLHTLPVLQPVLGTDRILPKSPVSGSSLTSLKLEPVMFTEVFLPEIGNVSIELDPAMSYAPMTDKKSAGFYQNGASYNAHSMVIYDVADPYYSNAVPRGTKLIENGKSDANIYYVKPEGRNLWWGQQNGRYSSTASEVIASLPTMGTNYFAHSISAGLVLDITRYVSIDLNRQVA